MKNILKTTITYALILSMALTMNISIVAATDNMAEPQQANPNEVKRVQAYHINPYYDDVVSEADLNIPLQEEIQNVSPFAARTIYYSSIEDIDDMVCDAMKNRTESIPIPWQQTGEFSNDGLGIWLDELIEAACQITDDPKAGDYLRWHYAGVGADSSGTKEGDVWKYNIVISFTYYTTAEQESALDNEVEELLSSLDISNDSSEYEKLTEIYNYMCQNISYVDDETLYDKSNVIKYTAYGALMDKKCVCQGYANLLYRLLKEVGVDVRIISGSGNGEAHGWNIVKINDKYYCVDATWDASYLQKGYEYLYFLKGYESFETDHVRDPEFMTDDFLAEYPISADDYDDRNHSYGEWSQISAATFTDAGLEYAFCSECGNTKIRLIPAVGSVALSTSAYTYNGKAKSPGIVVKDINGRTIDPSNYTVTTPDGRINAGKYTYTVAFKNRYEGTKQLAMTINPAKLTAASLSSTAYTYNAKTKTPSITVKAGSLTAANKITADSSAVDITYSSGRKNVGTYKVTVKGRGNYTGTLTKTFKINPKGVYISKLSKAKKAFTAKWKKPSATYRKQMTGYQIRYSTSSKMTKAKTVTVKSTKSTSKKISKLKSKKYYYVQIRTYKKSGSTYYYSGWSKAKKVKTR